MGRALKYLFYLLVLAGLGLAGYAALFDLPAPTEKVVIPLTPPTGE